MVRAITRPLPYSPTARTGALTPPTVRWGWSRSTRAPSFGRVTLMPGSCGSALQARWFASAPAASWVIGWRRPSSVSRGRKRSSLGGCPTGSTGSTAPSALDWYPPSPKECSPPTITKAPPSST